MQSFIFMIGLPFELTPSSLPGAGNFISPLVFWISKYCAADGLNLTNSVRLPLMVLSLRFSISMMWVQTSLSRPVSWETDG